jgi:hypothetical protein
MAHKKLFSLGEQMFAELARGPRQNLGQARANVGLVVEQDSRPLDKVHS